MLNAIPLSITMSFILITLITVGLFYTSTNRSKAVLVITFIWLLFQSIVSIKGFYTVTNESPPRFPLLVLPPLALIVLVFATLKGRMLIDAINLKTLTYLHTIRVGVELVLFALSIYKFVPQLMTFEGRNFDILAGLSAPVIAYFVFTKKMLGRKALLIWNFICLALLLNIVINAVLSVPSPFQQFAFEQPNVAILYFPFVWLPCCIVPIVLFAHLVAIKRLLSNNDPNDVLHVSLLKKNFRKKKSRA